MIERLLYKTIENKLFVGKVIILTGARQVGKTTLLKQLLRQREGVLWLNGDELQVQNLFANASADRLLSEFGDNKIVILDEAQRIENIGLRLKLIADSDSDIQVIATGSSAFELANKVNEPLTGRKWEYQMFPLSFGEMVAHHGKLKELRMLPRRIIYGYYPEVVTNDGNEVEILKLLTDAYLYKDILSWESIKHPDKLQTLLRALAYQIGSQVSYNELSQMCSMDSKTVERYINLLEQCYIIFRLPSFSRNLRHELKSSRKIYFYDNGIRNALIADYRAPEVRQDIGSLWENFVIAERMKSNEYYHRWVNRYFWRTKQQQEIDYLEEGGGKLHAYEMKWNPRAKASITKTFTDAYPNTDYQVITPDNIADFLLPDPIGD
ncbi:MAG: ATP-binding protein [Muribaculaceae bacterium]|nr:ATP-binding protein [Muribaculaceae bacterium]